MKYKFLNTVIEPCYLYIEGNEKEEFWDDSQNCYYFNIIDNGLYRDDVKLIGDKKYWIIFPVKPIDSIIKTENDFDKLVKWVVGDCSDYSDTEIYFEWDFENHKPTDNIIEIDE